MLEKGTLGRGGLLERIQFQVWTDAPDAHDAYFPYWNDWGTERAKEWNVEDGDQRFINKSNGDAT